MEKSQSNLEKNFIGMAIPNILTLTWPRETLQGPSLAQRSFHDDL